MNRRQAVVFTIQQTLGARQRPFHGPKTFATVLFCTMLVSGMALAQDFDHALWEERLLILIAPSANDPLAIRQKQALRDSHDAVLERRLRIIELYADHVSSASQTRPRQEKQAIRERLGAKPDTRELILIGLDGSIKRRTPLNTPVGEMFEQIDAMPMRRQEIEERRRTGLPVTRP